MKLVTWSPARRKPQPPPLWFVTNGELTVGPVRTDLLLRGVREGRVPDDCLVREFHWQGFRPLDQIREVRALREQGRITDAKDPSTEIETALARATDPGEVLLFALSLAVRRTGAGFGYVHRVGEPWRAPVTSSAHGPGTVERLGKRLASSDYMLGAARARYIVLGGAFQTRAHRDAMRRLSAGLYALRGVAMVPIFQRHGFSAMLELGRSDHAFRAHDDVELRAIAKAVAARLDTF